VNDAAGEQARMKTPPSSNRRFPVWLFDLDNTLHDATPHIFPHINRAMTDYVVAALQIPKEAASRVRVDYWQRYGATLNGMMRHHNTSPQHFLWHTHQFPQLADMLVFERGLAAMLRRLPGRKILVSNAPGHYAEAVLSIMRIRSHFDAVYSIEQLQFRPKPQVRGFLHLLRREGLRPSSCIMVEDSVANLRTARQLGMKTVLISASLNTPDWVDLRLQSVLDLPRQLGRL
jgi:putative hydrolase of the HAD superfamily